MPRDAPSGSASPCGTARMLGESWGEASVVLFIIQQILYTLALARLGSRSLEGTSLVRLR